MIGKDIVGYLWSDVKVFVICISDNDIDGVIIGGVVYVIVEENVEF